MNSEKLVFRLLTVSDIPSIAMVVYAYYLWTKLPDKLDVEKANSYQ